jgi:hypothetical protein
MKIWLSIAVATAVLALVTPASQGGPFHRTRGRGCCGGSAGVIADSCEGMAASCVTYTQEKRTVMVPKMETVMQDVTVTEYSMEPRKETVKVYKTEPVVTDEKYTYWDFELRPEKRRETYYEPKTVIKKEKVTYTVMEPTLEKRTGTRMVCQTESVVVPRTVMRDMGHYEDRCFQHTVSVRTYGTNCCGQVVACGCVPQIVSTTRRVWVPNCVAVTENVRTYQTRYVPESFDYNVTVCRPKTMQRDVDVAHCEWEKKERDVICQVCVRVEKQGTRKVVTCKTTSEDKTISYNVCVPHQVTKKVPVQVCRMVPQTIMVNVPVPVSVGCAGVMAASCCH